jgi:hypothetical protein
MLWSCSCYLTQTTHFKCRIEQQTVHEIHVAAVASTSLWTWLLLCC